MNKPDDEEPFLSRWSRMKRRAGSTSEPAPANAAEPAGPPQRPVASPDQETVTLEPATADQADARPPLDLEKLPRVEELTAESDIAAFLDSRVPAALRNAALARIWTLDPTIRDFIEVAENQWNWNVPGGAPFYELIEEGSMANFSFADATSAISRTLTSADEPVCAAVPDTVNSIEFSDQRKVDAVAEIPAAPHETVPASLPSSLGRSETLPLASQRVTAPDGELVATQQNSLVPRRRHGGALPL